MWDERSTTRDREPVLLRDVLAATTAALQQASREAEAVAASAAASTVASAGEAVMPAPRCGECGAETRRTARAIPGRRTRTGPAAAGACPYRSAA